MHQKPKEYGVLMVTGSGEWIMESERHRGRQQEGGESSWGWWESSSYTSATAALQTLNNMLGWEVEAVWTQPEGYQDAELARPMPVFLLSRPAEHPYNPESKNAHGTWGRDIPGSNDPH